MQGGLGMEALRQRFSSVDPRFGPVPLWWWSGEAVTEERLRWQMQKLRATGLRNLCVINLAPAGPTYGCPADAPPFYSERWWTLFGAALEEAERLGMFLWYYDQIGFSGANFPARLVADTPEFSGHHLRRFGADTALPSGAAVLGRIGGDVLASVRHGFDWLNPAAAGALLDRIHGEMERRHGDRLGRVIAGSFQDELQPMPTWSPRVPLLYQERYGEDLAPHLPLLFTEGPLAPEVRRRFYGLLAELAEEAFFRPLGEWHARHGMLLGCDQAGHARTVDPHGAQRIYLDYFATHRHYSAPGSDMDGEAKAHSSLVHAYGGKRVWLEGFHSSGWGGTVEETMHWLIPWLQAGVTLFDPHAVYYTTRGGWWEWAPPDTGWRQPYAEHYPIFSDTVSRVCWLLAQGRHLCDVAVYYPGHVLWEHMSPGDQRPGEHLQQTAGRDPDTIAGHIRSVYWALVGRQARAQATLGVLRRERWDFDLLDERALATGRVEGASIGVGEEQYPVVLLPGAIPPEGTAQRQLAAFVASGGLLVAVSVPADANLPAGTVRVATPEEVPSVLASHLMRRADGPGMALARRIGPVDVFLLLPPFDALRTMHVASDAPPALPAHSSYALETEGVPELWDPVSGRQRPLPFRREGRRVVIDAPFTDWPAALVVCRPKDLAPASDHPLLEAASEPETRAGVWRELPEKGWRVRVESTLDNRYGDFELLGHHDFNPVERRLFRVQTETGDGDGLACGWNRPDVSDADWPERLWSEAARWSVCRGERFVGDKAQPVVYSTQFGDMAFRDWAGRMGRIPRTFLHLGEAQSGEVLWAMTHVIAPSDGVYWLQVEGAVVKEAFLGETQVLFPDPSGQYVAVARVRLRAGANQLLLRCTSVRQGSVRVGVQVTVERPEPHPAWVIPGAAREAKNRTLRYEIDCPEPAREVRAHFAVHGHVALWVNERLVAVEGEFNPYFRDGQQAVDLTPYWRVGKNRLSLHFPEGTGDERAFVDGIALLGDGRAIPFATGPGWSDGEGQPAVPMAHTDAWDWLWVRPRSHPLADVGWLMPASVPQPSPLPFVLDPATARQPVWLRFPLPVGARRLEVMAQGAVRAWVAGNEVEVHAGVAHFPAQPAGALCALRIEPRSFAPEAAVLQAPVVLQLDAATGCLGDWRTALQLPHHSGVVEYEMRVQGTGSRAWLDLGYVRGTAQVWVDGHAVGTRLWHPFRFALGEAWGVGSHRLRIRVTNTLAPHYEVGRPTFLVLGGQAASGLVGPVRLAEEE